MNIQQKLTKSEGIKIAVVDDDGKEAGRGFLYLMYNDLHKRPFGFIEDVFVNEACRGQGTGTKIVKTIINEAKKQNCYKLIMTSRYDRTRVHELYNKLGFTDWGKEFRMNLNN